MKNILLKTAILIFLIVNGFEVKSQTCDLTIDNFSNCTVTITVLNSTMTPIIAFGTPTVNSNGGQYVWPSCTNPGDVPAYFQVDYGTCNSIIVDLSTNNFGPFSPGLCCPCGGITMSASALQNACGGTFWVYHLDIH